MTKTKDGAVSQRRAPEGATIRRLVIPRLLAAGWSEDAWEREYTITGEPRTVVDGRVTRGRPLQADFALLHGEQPICVVEVKHSLRNVRTGVQQARDYTRRLDLPLAYERSLVAPERTREAARYLTEFLRRRDDMGKTIVFCADQDHASRFREELVNLNSDLMRRYGDWVVRITADEGDRGVILLDRFQDPESDTPVVVTTSRLLSTGIDVPMVKTIVLFRRIESTVEFKQVIGRGSRLDPERGKEYFTIIDFMGATRKFEDPDFDGPPIRVVEQGSDAEPPGAPETGEDAEADAVTVAEPEPSYDPEEEPADQGDGEVPGAEDEAEIVRRSHRYVVDGIEVHIASEAVYVMDSDSGRLQMVRYEHWVRERARSLQLEPSSLLAQWATVRGRRELRELLKETLAFDVGTLATRLNRPECDPIDLLVWLAWDLPLMSRRERVERFAREERAFLDTFPPRARQILASMLDKYAANGPDDLDPAVLHTQPFASMGRPAELAAEFGGVAEMHRTIDHLGQRLLAA